MKDEEAVGEGDRRWVGFREELCSTKGGRSCFLSGSSLFATIAAVEVEEVTLIVEAVVRAAFFPGVAWFFAY